MKHGRQTLVLRLVIVLASLALTAFGAAQDGPQSSDPDALPAVLAASTADFELYGDPEVYVSLHFAVREVDDREVIQELIQVLGDGTRSRVSEHALCAFLAGNGGNPRVDGGSGTGRVDGGGLLQPLVQPFEPVDLDHAWTGSLEAPVESVSLAIIDAFDLPWLLDLSQAASSSPDSNDAWLEFVREVTIARAMPIPDGHGWEVPHGHLVFYHALRALSYPAIQRAHVQWQQLDDRHVRLELTVGEVPHVIDLFHMEFDGLHGLVEALDLVHTDDFEDHQVVMSWGISDCAVVESYEDAAASGAGSVSYLVHLNVLVADHVGRELIEELCTAFAPYLPVVPTSDGEAALPCDDAFATVVALVELDLQAADHADWPGDQAAGDRTRLFASAGNQALPFPMPTAAWPGVMGVAACSPSEPAKAWFSNRGDYLPWEHVVAPGAWFASNLLGALDEDAGYWGTSFAAPYAAIHAHQAINAGAAGPHSLPPCQAANSPDGP